MGPAEPQTLLQVVDTLDPHGTPASPALPDEEVHVMSRLFEGQASDLRYRRQTWSRYSADCCLIQGNQQELVKLWQTGNDATAIEVVPLLVFSLGGNVHVSSHVHAKVTPSNAIKG